MTFGSIMGVLLTLGFVLALLGVTLKLLRRFAPSTAGGGGARLRMEIVQRLALGPKQGIAVIRVGERVVAVSVGEGGVNRLFELEETELGTRDSNGRDSGLGRVPAEGGRWDSGARPTSPLDFGSALKGALRTAGLVLAFAIATTSAAHAQRGTQTPARAPRPAATAPAVAATGASPTQMVQRLAADSRVQPPAFGGHPPESRVPSPGLPNMDLKIGTATGCA